MIFTDEDLERLKLFIHSEMAGWLPEGQLAIESEILTALLVRLEAAEGVCALVELEVDRSLEPDNYYNDAISIWRKAAAK